LESLGDLLKIVNSPAYFFDRDSHKILACNVQFASLMEYELIELLKMSVEELRPIEDYALLAKALASSPPEGAVEWRYKTRTGTLLFVQLIYRNSVFIEPETNQKRDVRMVVISRWDTVPVKTADALFGA
jgi:PAS domain-containing protein